MSLPCGKFVVRFPARVETKLKGNGKVSWYGVNGILAGIQRTKRTREGMAILLSDVWHSAVIDFGYVISRILFIKFKFSRNKVFVVVEYGHNEEDSEERERFCNDLGRIVDK